MVAHLQTFHGHKVTKQELSGMVAHLHTFHAVVDAGYKDASPLECSVRSDELPMSMRMHFCLLSRAANVRARAYAHGHVCVRARA